MILRFGTVPVVRSLFVCLMGQRMSIAHPSVLHLEPVTGRLFQLRVRWRAGRVLIGVACVAVTLTGRPAAAADQGALAALLGTWSGAGQVRLDNGNAEAVKCKAFYVDKAPGVGVALRCASSGSKIDLRATIALNGSELSGNWEERQFNAAGSVTGTSIGNRLSLLIDGGGLKASMAVTTVGARQTLAVASETGGFRGLTVTLARD